MDKHTAEIVADVEITPEQLADLFWSMNQFEARRFFNQLGMAAPFEDFASQLHEVTASQESSVVLSDKAKRLMQLIGDYAQNSI